MQDFEFDCEMMRYGSGVMVALGNSERDMDCLLKIEIRFEQMECICVDRN